MWASKTSIDSKYQIAWHYDAEDHKLDIQNNENIQYLHFVP
jgi:hypothetical protein